MFGEFLHEDIFHMAAAYAFHIAESQAFLDGNKRTGVAAALTFLDMNSVSYGAGIRDELYKALFDIAEHRLDKAGLATLLRELMV
jgi:death-on-curing protein